jgi:hypothetical protein
MKNEQLQGIATLKSVGVCGLLGAAAGTAVFFLLSQTWKDAFSCRDCAGIGAAIGTLCHRVAVVAGPIVTYYRRQLQICGEVWIGSMSQENAALIRMRLCEAHYLGDLPPARALVSIPIKAETVETDPARNPPKIPSTTTR